MTARCACLVAWRGEGFGFIDALDEPAEQVFSLAHELAHFLRDYLRPRATVAERLGRSALQVLDGLRPATRAERLRAVLRTVPLGPFAHLLRRDDCGRPLAPAERKEFRVVTSTDLRRADVRQRPDILGKKLEEIKQEAPFAYKGIGPVNTLAAAGIARPVGELTPLTTIKG